ncbi:hypothetical protein AB0M43_34905 [Longispora sp. NPDC051575]|uniref:hypothetical protein n=1 Tax=Longispora sp. NPDC051575 TaxID=3154943 RepID=UPI0034348ED5
MITRRHLLAAALALPTAIASLANSPVCCTFTDPDLHDIGCPVGLARACEDCEARPGEDCTVFCPGNLR